MDFLQETVNYNWQRLATFGWHQYLKQGKGLLMLIEQAVGPTEINYISFEQLAAIEPEIRTSVDPSITDYNPERSFVLGYKSLAGVFSWRVVHSPEVKNAEAARLQDEGILVQYKTMVGPLSSEVLDEEQ